MLKKLLRYFSPPGTGVLAVPSPSQSHTIYFGEFCVDLSKHVLYKKHERIKLAPKEFDTLRVLAENSGHLVTKEQIIHEVWRDTFIGDTSLTRNISVLRKIIGPDVIETVPKRGYLFTAKTEESIEATPCSGVDSVGQMDATGRFKSMSGPGDYSPPLLRVERPSFKGIAISALVLLMEAAFAKK
jgi:DNA-binding winged helix-turn-helix (wHTH) protein